VWSDAIAFHEAIIDAPEDAALRRVFADWLMERGDPQGEFIHLQCALETLPKDDDTYWPSLARAELLRRSHGKRWAGDLRRLVKRWSFRRGLVESITLRAADFLTHADELFRLAPIREARLLESEPLLAELAHSPHLARIRSLDLRHQSIDVRAFQTLMHARHLTRLERLNLRGTALCCNEGMQVIAGCEKLAHLAALDLSDHRASLQDRQRDSREDYPTRSC
jgi:uncharacterized protein (TIGR02996 family)